MSIKDAILNLVNVVYRQDPFTKDLTQAVSTVFQRIIDFCESIKNNMFFDSLDEDGAKWWENFLKITPSSSQTLEDRQAKIQAKWLSKYHNDMDLIQRVCDAWKNGEVDVDFVNGKIQIQFVASYGVPSDLDSIKESIEEVKPAHLSFEFLFKYLLIENIDDVKTIEEIEQITLDMFARGK